MRVLLRNVRVEHEHTLVGFVRVANGLGLGLGFVNYNLLTYYDTCNMFGNFMSLIFLFENFIFTQICFKNIVYVFNDCTFGIYKIKHKNRGKYEISK